MKHRNLNTEDWSRTAIDSLFERGKLPDWKEFIDTLKKDENLAKETLYMCKHHNNQDSAKLAFVFLEEFYPDLVQ